MTLRIIAFAFLILFSSECFSQSYYFGPKAGLSIGTQKWLRNTGNRPLLNIHGDFFMESYDENLTGSFYGSLGWHVRGSSFRILNLNNFESLSRGYNFNNISLQFGAKKPGRFSSQLRYFYGFGLRAEYTVSTNLTEFASTTYALFFPMEQFVVKFIYGVSVNGGFIWDKNEFFQPFIEFSFHPDLSAQYNQPISFMAVNPWNNQPVTIQPNKIRNVSFEISVGMRFLRKVIYE